MGRRVRVELADCPTGTLKGLSSPFEREMRVVQRWRRQVPTHNWYVTPDFDALLDPAGS